MNKSKNKNNQKEENSPLMNININYINFNKFNDDKTNTMSINNKANKNKHFLYRIINNMPVKSNNVDEISPKHEINTNKINSLGKKDYSFFIMKINQIKKNKKTMNNLNDFLKNKYLSKAKNSSFYNIKNSKNGTLVNDKNNKNICSNSNLIIKKGQNLKKIFSYKSSFGVMKKNLMDNYQKMLAHSPMTSRNKRKNSIDSSNFNVTSNMCFSSGKNNLNSQKENFSLVPQNNLYRLMNSNSRNKIKLILSKKQSSKKSSEKCTIIGNSISQKNYKLKINQNTIFQKNNSFLNKTVFNKKQIMNNNRKLEHIKNLANIKDKIHINKIYENINNGNIPVLSHKNSCDSFKPNKIHHSNSRNNINSNCYKNKKNNKTSFIKDFLKAFNNSKYSNPKYPFSSREFQK